jgi:uncharacterized membrane-anchored protein
VIEYNKISHNGTHFVSPHAILGLITYILTALQAVVGITQYFVPQLYGGEANAKKLYKYHRVGGYVILLAMLATVVLVGALILLIGVVPRIRLNKFGYLAGR